MDETEGTTRSEQFQRTFGKACYDGRVDFSTVRPGTEEAIRERLLRESLKRELPEPCVEDEIPTWGEFYSESISEWTPDEEDAEDGS